IAKRRPEPLRDPAGRCRGIEPRLVQRPNQVRAPKGPDHGAGIHDFSASDEQLGEREQRMVEWDIGRALACNRRRNAQRDEQYEERAEHGTNLVARHSALGTRHSALGRSRLLLLLLLLLLVLCYWSLTPSAECRVPRAEIRSTFES